MTMFSRKKKDLNPNPSRNTVAKPTTILVSEKDKPVRGKTLLGLGDVIYENVKAEEQETTPKKTSRVSPEIAQKNSPSSSHLPAEIAQNQATKWRYFFKKESKSVEKDKKQAFKTKNVSDMEFDKTETTKVRTISNTTDSNKGGGGGGGGGESGKKVAKQQDQNSKPHNKNRKDSGIFLLSDSSDSSLTSELSQRSMGSSGSGSSAATISTGLSNPSILKGDHSKTVIPPDEAWLASVEARLKAETKNSPTLTLAQFESALQVKGSFFVARCFHLFDTGKAGEPTVQVVIQQLRALVLGSPTDKIRFLFNLYNINGSGKINKNEIREVLKCCMQDSQLQFTSENLQDMAEAVIIAADKDRDGKISFEELKALLHKHMGDAENLVVSSLLTTASTVVDYELSPFTPQDCAEKPQFWGRHFSKTYIQNNLKKVVFLLVYIFVNLGLAALNAWLYWSSNTWVIVARACGMALDFNSTFILVLMLRRLLTALRATPLAKVLPFDQYVMFHKLCGYTILLQSLVHSAAHLGNAFVISKDLKMSVEELIFTTRADIGWVEGTAPLTGVALCVVLVVMVTLSLPFVRRSGYFEVFYWSHKLYLVFWALLILHAGNFWKWFLVPGLVFVLESVSRMACVRSIHRGQTYIERVRLFPSEVTQLVISRPPGLTFRPGDYVFLQVPAIAKYEWHPFTISSAPEEEDSIWVHIRINGSWTRSLHDYFVNYATDVEEGAVGDVVVRKSEIRRRASSIAWFKQKPLKARKIDANIRRRVVDKDVRVLCHIDGPYGTPTRHIFEAEHAVLIGSGIGVTPFASILQAIVNQFKASSVQCPCCQHTWCHALPASISRLKKVDFIWINRNQRHFEWFASLLSRLERGVVVEGGLGDVFDMQMFMTSAPPKTDMKGLILQLALDLVHEADKTDLVTGLRTRTQAGRPDFDQVFTQIQATARGHVTVFFCGSPLLGRTLKQYSHRYGFSFRQEVF